MHFCQLFEAVNHKLTMMEQFKQFKTLFDKKIIKLTNPKLQIAFYSYSILHITKESDIDENQSILKNLQESKVLIIGHFKEIGIKDEDIFIVHNWFF